LVAKSVEEGSSNSSCRWCKCTQGGKELGRSKKEKLNPVMDLTKENSLI
jgi:hypothetical protein